MSGVRRGSRGDGHTGGTGTVDRSDDSGGATVPGGIDVSGLAPSVLSAVGGAVTVATAGEWVFLAVGGGTLTPATVLVQALLNLLPGVALVYAGVELRNRFAPERHARVVGWCLGGLVSSLGANAVLMVTFPPDPAVFAVGWARTAAAFGTVAGTTIGVIEARALERALATERARVRAEEAERRRERLAYLNSLLRHEVLNAANVIVGNAAYVVEDDDVDGVTSERFRAVERQGQRLADVVSDVRLLTEAVDTDRKIEPVDLVDVLERELEILRDRHESVAVETDFPETATVLADGLVGHAFEHLLDNAVEHNESGQPAVTVAVERTAERVLVEVADDGPGIPPAERNAMFERETAHNHGLGLFLVRTLVERYDGSVELAETGADGSVFSVELPRRSDVESHRTTDESRQCRTDGERALEASDTREERDTADEDGHPALS